MGILGTPRPYRHFGVVRLFLVAGMKCCLDFICISSVTNVEHCALYLICLFFLCFEDFIWFQILILHCLGVVFFGFILLGVHWTSWICVVTLSH